MRADTAMAVLIVGSAAPAVLAQEPCGTSADKVTYGAGGGTGVTDFLLLLGHWGPCP